MLYQGGASGGCGSRYSRGLGLFIVEAISSLLSSSQLFSSLLGSFVLCFTYGGIIYNTYLPRLS